MHSGMDVIRVWNGCSRNTVRSGLGEWTLHYSVACFSSRSICHACLQFTPSTSAKFQEYACGSTSPQHVDLRPSSL